MTLRTKFKGSVQAIFGVERVTLITFGVLYSDTQIVLIVR